jgi:hypothetical protein
MKEYEVLPDVLDYNLKVIILGLQLQINRQKTVLTMVVPSRT